MEGKQPVITRSREPRSLTLLPGGKKWLRCLCGQVHYTVTGDPAFSGICHRRNCQRYTGSAFETIVAFPTEAIKVQGELKTYQDTGDSGQPVFRRFCANRGSGVIADVNVLPGMTLVLAGPHAHDGSVLQ